MQLLLVGVTLAVLKMHGIIEIWQEFGTTQHFPWVWVPHKFALLG